MRPGDLIICPKCQTPMVHTKKLANGGIEFVCKCPGCDQFMCASNSCDECKFIVHSDKCPCGGKIISEVNTVDVECGFSYDIIFEYCMDCGYLRAMFPMIPTEE